MKRLILAAVLGALALPGCIVAVERRDTPRYNPPPPPPPPPPAMVTVQWNDCRTVILREYYDCDWDTVGTFDYYEDTCGIPEDDLFFLLHISRTCNANFHEVVFHYNRCGRILWDVCLFYRIPTWGLYVDIPMGYRCPPAYARAYGFYWRRDPRIRLTNYECHALFYLRLSVGYYGWTYRDTFVRWNGCVDRNERFVVVVHREYPLYAARGGQNWNNRPVVKIVERPERGGNIVQQLHQQREASVKRVVVEVDRRKTTGQVVVLPPKREEIDRHREESRRHFEEERKREKEELAKEPPAERQKEREREKELEKERDREKGPPPPKEKEKEREKQPPPPKEREKEREKQPPPPKEREKEREKQPPPPPKEKEKEREKQPPPPPKEKEKEREKQPPPPPKEKEKEREKQPPPPPPKERDRRPPPPPPPKDDDKKDDKKQDEKKQDDKKQDDKKKDDGGRKDKGGRTK